MLSATTNRINLYISMGNKSGLPIAVIIFFCCVSIVYACEKSDASALEANMNKWQEAQWHSYSYVVQRECFCLPEFRKATRVTVENDKVVAASFVGEEDEAVSEQVLTGLSTIEGWFNVIDRAVTNKADRLDVIYHQELGYPEEISIDMHPRIADDEQKIVISELVRR